LKEIINNKAEGQEPKCFQVKAINIKWMEAILIRSQQLIKAKFLNTRPT